MSASLEELFPFEYVGTGYWRRMGVPRGEKADILHANQAIAYLHQAITALSAAEPATPLLPESSMLESSRHHVFCVHNRWVGTFCPECAHSGFRSEANQLEALNDLAKLSYEARAKAVPLSKTWADVDAWNRQAERCGVEAVYKAILDAQAVASAPLAVDGTPETDLQLAQELYDVYITHHGTPRKLLTEVDAWERGYWTACARWVNRQYRQDVRWQVAEEAIRVVQDAHPDQMGCQTGVKIAQALRTHFGLPEKG